MHLPPFLVLGLGNRLMGDDGAGILACEGLASAADPDITVVDGGTVGMALLPLIEESRALIVLDAAKTGRRPGTVTAFEGVDMMRLLAGRLKSAHEVALADLMAAAHLRGRVPVNHALVAVEPERIALGLDPSPPVASAIDRMIEKTLELRQRWASEVAVV